MPLIIAFFLVAIPICFIVGVVLFILAKDKPEDKKVKVRVLSAVLAIGPIVLLFILLSAWGFIRIWQTSHL